MNRREAFKSSAMAGLATLMGFRARKLNPEWLYPNGVGRNAQSVFKHPDGKSSTIVVIGEDGFVKNPPEGIEVRSKFVNTRYIPTDKPNVFRVEFDVVEIPKYL